MTPGDIEAQEDAQDVAVLNAAIARENELGKDAARADYLPLDAVQRLLDGASSVRVWRDHRGLSLHTLANQAEISQADLSAIEDLTMIASPQVMKRLAVALGVSAEDLTR